MKIKDLAERSGFSAATLRYYEKIGILPAPARSGAGYRQYDGRSIERLAFIARAKQLGCTLEEISALTVAWDGGRCGPVQDRLRALVADKIASAQEQTVALTTLTAELQQAARDLETDRPDGPCDDACGCRTDVGDRAPVSVALVAKPMTVPAEDVPIACTLSGASMRGRLHEWQTLLDRHGDIGGGVRSRIAIAGGMRLQFDEGVDLAVLARLAASEHECCRFFSFAITVDSRGVGLEITAPSEAAEIVHALFGMPA